MKQGLREEDTAFLVTKGQLANGSTTLPQTADLLSDTKNSTHALK